MIYTSIYHPLPGYVHIFCLQRFSSTFESTVCILKIAFMQYNKQNFPPSLRLLGSAVAQW